MDGLLPAYNRYLAPHDVQLVDQFFTEISSLQPDKRVFLVGRRTISRTSIQGCFEVAASRRN